MTPCDTGLAAEAAKSPNLPAAEAAADGIVRDAADAPHRTASGPVRIVSLVPSLTETLCALGLSGSIVGRTGFCIHPRELVRPIPKVGGTKTVDVERVRALAPTHLVVNIDENERPTVEALAAQVPHVVVTHPIEVDDNRALYALLGHVFGRMDAARALASALDAARAEAHAACAGLPARRVVYAIWKDPWMTVAADTYIARMLAEVGLQVAAVTPSGGTARYPAFSLGAVDWPKVDALLLSSEPYRFGDRHAAALRGDARLRGARVCTIDGEMTSWYGSRAIAGLRYLAGFRRALDDACARSPGRS